MGFLFFYFGYGHGKHKNYKNFMSMLIHGGLILKVQLEKGGKDEKKNDIKKEK